MAKPAFDASKPFEPTEAPPVARPAFDASKPFERVAPRRTLNTEAAMKDEEAKLLDSMGTGGRFMAGLGAGMYNTGKNVADILGHIPGLGDIRPDAAKWKEEQELSRGLLDTGAGKLGNLAGEIAATLPLGVGAGAGARAVATKLLPKAVQFATPLLGLAGEGAAQGGVLAGPGNRGAGMLAGGATGLGLGLGGRLLGALGERFAGNARAAQAKAAYQAAAPAAQKATSTLGKAWDYARQHAESGVGSAIGGFLGHHFGGPLGMAAGMAAGRAGAKALTGALAKRANPLALYNTLGGLSRGLGGFLGNEATTAGIAPAIVSAMSDDALEKQRALAQALAVAGGT